MNVLLGVLLAVLFGVAGLAYFAVWWYGLLVSMMMATGMNWVVLMMLAIVLVLMLDKVGIVFAFAGFFGTITQLDWPWYVALLVYAPEVALILAGTSFAAVIALISSLFRR